MPINIKEKTRTGVINPIFTCQPAGAQYASIGIKDCIPLVHGGQGCCMFIRLLFAQHLKENFDIASSSLHESAAVFGGVPRIEDGVMTLLQRYPHIRTIPIITTCSTETIGDDIEGTIRKLDKRIKEQMPGRKVKLVAMHTPSYSGSQVTGYNEAVEALVRTFATAGVKNEKINVFTGWVNPGDVIEIKHLLAEMGIDGNVLIDTETFDAPTMPDKSAFTYGNTTIEDLTDTANAKGSIVLAKYEGGSAADYLKSEFDVPVAMGHLPIGIKNTDAFIANLAKLSGKPVPKSLVEERGRAIDAMADLAHMFFADKKVALYGDPDLVMALAEFCLEVELKPTLLLFGDDSKQVAKDGRLKELGDKVDYEIEAIWNADLWELEEHIKNNPGDIDIIMGHSKGRYIAIDNKIPMIRVGFPTFDRAGVWKKPVIGYRGTELLAETIANTLFADMEAKHNREWVLNTW